MHPIVERALVEVVRELPLAELELLLCRLEWIAGDRDQAQRLRQRVDELRALLPAPDR